MMLNNDVEQIKVVFHTSVDVEQVGGFNPSQRIIPSIVKQTKKYGHTWKRIPNLIQY